MTLALVGGTHRTVPIGLREKLAFSAEQAAQALSLSQLTRQQQRPGPLRERLPPLGPQALELLAGQASWHRPTLRLQAQVQSVPMREGC